MKRIMTRVLVAEIQIRRDNSARKSFDAPNALHHTCWIFQAWRLFSLAWDSQKFTRKHSGHLEISSCCWWRLSCATSAIEDLHKYDRGHTYGSIYCTVLKCNWFHYLKTGTGKTVHKCIPVIHCLFTFHQANISLFYNFALNVCLYFCL